MKNKLVLGPILGLESDALYTLTFVTNASVVAAQVKYNHEVVAAYLLGKIHSGLVLRAELTIPVGDLKQVNS